MAASVTSSIKFVTATGINTASTGNITPSGSNRLLRVSIFTGDDSGAQPTSVLFGSVAGVGGTALTKLRGDSLTVNGEGSIWYLVAPSTSAGNIFITWPATQAEQLVIVEAIQDADQSTIFGTTAFATGTNTSPTVNATTVSGDLVLNSIFMLDVTGSSRTIAVAAGQTSIQEIEGADTTFEANGTSSITATSTSTTNAWTISGVITGGWNIYAHSIIAAAGGGGAATNQSSKSLMGVGAR